MRPKLWNGASAVGEARVRGNRLIDTPYLTASGPGFMAYKKGDFHEVFLEEPTSEVGIPAFYSLGEVDGLERLVGSSTCKNTFRKLGKVDANAFSIPNLLYIGANIGIVPVDVNPPYFYLYYTSNGKRFKEEGLFESRLPKIGQGGIWFEVVIGAVTGAGKNGHTWGLSLRARDGNGVHFGRCAVKRNGEWVYGATLRYVDFDCSIMRITRLNPTTLIAFTGVYARKERELPPQCFTSVSEDNGLTWQFVSFVPVFDIDENAVQPESYNLAISEVVDSFSAQAVNPTTSVCIAQFRKIAPDFTSYSYQYRVFRFQKIGSSWNFTQVSELNDEFIALDEGFLFDDSASPNVQGAIFQWRPHHDSLVHHKLFISTNAGLTWTIRTLPWEARKTGVVVWIDEKTMVCPVHDGVDYVVYESLNLGATWEKRATLWGGLPPPTGGTILRQFGIVRRFRDRLGRPVAATPGAPWITDSSESYPDG